MNLPDLAPDITFAPLGCSAGDIDFAFEIKRAALGPHIAVRWGWDDAFQRAVHERRYSAKPFFAIQRADQRIGTISVEVLPTHMWLGEFYLLPALHGQGIGTAILRHCLALADGLKRPVRLEYLQWNPVGTLYRRWGFVERGRSDIHCFLERPLPLSSDGGGDLGVTYPVRPARREDAEGISRVVVSTLRETNAKDYPETVIARLEQNFSPPAILDLLASRLVFVAVHGDAVVGTASLDGAMARTVFIKPAFQDRGIGRALMAEVERAAAAKGIAVLTVRSSITAERFYAKLGFNAVRDNDYGEERTIIMERLLPVFSGER